MINLCSDIIGEQDITLLRDWLADIPRLTKGEKTVEFENKFARFLGCKHAIYCNSGSSANLLITSALKQSGKLKNNKIIVPQISWSTTVFPVIQLGLEPILCDCNLNNLGIDVDHLKDIIKKEQPSALILVHVLGFDSHIQDIIDICKKEGILVVEDTCESLGSSVNNQNLGTFGVASSFSFYFGHHISTIEGGMVCTNNKDFADIVRMIRSHGWDRDLDTQTQNIYRKQHNIGELDTLYTFYYAGYNLRSTDLQAFIGINQIEKIPHIIQCRQANYHTYKMLLNDDFWKPRPTKHQDTVSNMGYPIIVKNRKRLYKALVENNIECRPLLSGSMGSQPAWKNIYGESRMPHSDLIDIHGMYLPNHPDLTDEDIKTVCEIVNIHGEKI